MVHFGKKKLEEEFEKVGELSGELIEISKELREKLNELEELKEEVEKLKKKYLHKKLELAKKLPEILEVFKAFIQSENDQKMLEELAKETQDKENPNERQGHN